MYELKTDSIGQLYLVLNDGSPQGSVIPCDFGNVAFQNFMYWFQAGNQLPGMPPRYDPSMP